MRSIFGTFAPLLMMLVLGCSTVDANECWPNTSGGFGGGGTIPIGAGVGATTSGDFMSPPPKEPLDYDGASEADNPCMGSTIVRYFEPSTFQFVTTLADDGTDKGGGWQVAKAGLVVGPGPNGAPHVCFAVIEMPLRTSEWGSVPPKIAAIYTAKVANATATILEKKGDFDLPTGVFCDRFDTEMKEQFKNLFPGMGARTKVKSP